MSLSKEVEAFLIDLSNALGQMTHVVGKTDCIKPHEDGKKHSVSYYEHGRMSMSVEKRQELITRLNDLLKPGWNPFMNAKEAASALDISSPETIKNWLEGGHFPGGVKLPDGQWSYSRSYVEEMQERLQDIREVNSKGYLNVKDENV